VRALPDNASLPVSVSFSSYAKAASECGAWVAEFSNTNHQLGPGAAGAPSRFFSADFDAFVPTSSVPCSKTSLYVSAWGWIDDGGGTGHWVSLVDNKLYTGAPSGSGTCTTNASGADWSWAQGDMTRFSKVRLSVGAETGSSGGGAATKVTWFDTTALAL
jgi:hypothetical protein